MKHYYYFFLTFIIISCASIDSSLIEKGQRAVAFEFLSKGGFLPYWPKDTLLFEKRLHGFMNEFEFTNEIKTPLRKVKFLLYYYKGMCPSGNNLVVFYKDTILVSQFYDQENGYGCDSLIDFINQCLAEEKPLAKDQIKDMAECITKLSDPGSDDYKIISSWKDILWNSDSKIGNDCSASMADSIKIMIKPITISSHDDILEAEYFVWNKQNSWMRKIKLIVYSDNQLEVTNQRIGKYGMGYIPL